MNISTFALILGIAYIGAGLLGLIPAALMAPPPDAPATRFDYFYGYLLGLFPVNGLHSLVHLAIGAWALAAWHGMANAHVFARSLAILYGVLAVMGLIPGMNTVFGLIPIHGHDVWLHAATAAAAAYFGWLHAPVAKERRSPMHDRRQRMFPVARERRLGLADRRQMAYSGA